MKAKRILLLLLLFFGLAVTLKAEGEGDDNGSTQPTQPVKKVTYPSNPNRPKVPSHAVILFSYHKATETAHFDLPADIEYIDILLQNCETGFTFAGYASASDPEWHQPLTAGEYYIECTADNGDVYAGYIYL